MATGQTLGTISGVVTGPRGEPLAGVELRARATSTAEWPSSQSAVTAANGSYTIALPPGVYYVRTTNHAGQIDELFNDFPCFGGICPGDARTPVAGTALTVTAGTATPAADFSLGGIHYDADGLIVHAPKVEHPYGDGGDTCAREGWYWLGVWIRQNTPGLEPWTVPRKLTFDQVLDLLEPNHDGIFYRHPKLAPWNNPFDHGDESHGFTRDQMVPIVAAMGVWGKWDRIRRLWDALPESAAGKHTFNGEYVNWLGGPSQDCLAIKKRGCDATRDCSLKVDPRDCSLQVDTQDCSLKQDTRSCNYCIVSNWFTGGCVLYGNDPFCEAAKAATNASYAAGKAACEAAKAANNSFYVGQKIACEAAKGVQNAAYKAEKDSCEIIKTTEKLACEGQKAIDYAFCASTSKHTGDLVGPDTVNLFKRAVGEPWFQLVSSLVYQSPNLQTLVPGGALGEFELLGGVDVRLLLSSTGEFVTDPGEKERGPMDNTGDDLNLIVTLLMSALRYPSAESTAAINRYGTFRAHSFGSYLKTYRATYGYDPGLGSGDPRITFQRMFDGVASGWRPDVPAVNGAVRWYLRAEKGGNPQTAELYDPIFDLFVTHQSSTTPPTNPPPKITGVSPASGSGGTLVTITGTNLLPGTTVLMGGAEATGVAVLSSTTLTALAPARSPGVADVAVTVPWPGGGTAFLANAFTFGAAVIVTTHPTNQSIPAGQVVTFSAEARGTPTPTVQWQMSTDTGSTWTDLPGATATAYGFPVNYTDSMRRYRAMFASTAGTAVSGAATLTVTSVGATVTRVVPASGATAGGTTITIIGSGFVRSASVKVGGVATPNVTVVNATTITATTAAHAAGAVDVVVTTAAGSAALAGGFTYAEGVMSVSAAFSHTCAVTKTGGVTCWGSGHFGKLGDGTVTDHTTPTPVLGLGGGVIGVQGGDLHTCALTSGGGVLCWGANYYGELGDGTQIEWWTPNPVLGLSSGVVAIAAGARHTCALTASGAVKCWGDNGAGQLGDGTSGGGLIRLTPMPVSDLTSGVVAIAAGGFHTCALTTGGAVKCWGSNIKGQLGDGTPGTAATRSTPMPVSGLTSGVVAIAAGGGHTCALTTGGVVKCWGDNWAGQLGDGTTTNRTTPTPVIGLGSGVVALAPGAASAHTCVRLTGGAVKCWGKNWGGQLGDGTRTNRTIPTAVIGLSRGVAAIATGENYSCAVLAGGGLRCWGDNDLGQLGVGTKAPVPTVVDVTGYKVVDVAPRATGVTLSGAPRVGQTLTGSYAYGDVEGDAEGPTTFRWLRNGSAIGGATARTYAVVAADAGATLTFEVLPAAATGTSLGLPVSSAGQTIGATAEAPTITGITPGDATLSVAFATPGSDGGATITNYDYSTDDGATWTARSPVATTSPMSLAGLTNGTTYAVKLRAVNAAGPGAPSAARTGTPAVNTYRLTVVNEGSGTGTVTGSLGISCGATCTGESTQSTSVTLTATPAPGSVFNGWKTWWATMGLIGQKPCAHTGPCGFLMEQSRTVTANFRRLRLTQYLAEGATSAFFDTRLALLNPGAMAATATLTFQVKTSATCPSGCVRSYAVPVGARTRVTIDPKTIPAIAADFVNAEFSTKVTADQELVVGRTMSWDASGYGAHAEAAVLAPASTWYVAEGSTVSGFNLFYLFQNPNPAEAQVRVRYLRPSGAPLEKSYTLPPASRTNIWVNQETFGGAGRALSSTDVSAVIEVTNAQPIIVERAMYLDLPGQVFGAGHESAGVTAPATQWFLAEGATGEFFDLFVLIANPNDTAAQIEATYLLPDGSTVVKAYTVAANSRFNIWVDLEDARLANTAVSTAIRSTNDVPVIVERSMWWPGTVSQWYEAHNSPGATTTSTKWALADGEVGGTRGVDTYLLIANSSSESAELMVTLLFGDGTSAEKSFVVVRNSRFNVDVRTEFPAALDRRFGVIVESTTRTNGYCTLMGTGVFSSVDCSPVPIVVEHAMYWNARGQTWAAGTNALATPLQ